MTLLEVDQLCIQVGGRMLVEQLDLKVNPNECWVVLGRNGTGKTRLIHQLVGLDAPSTKVRLDGQVIPKLSAKQRARRVALLLQHSQLGFRQTTLQLVLGGGFARHNGWESHTDLAKAEHCLIQVGLQDSAQRQAESLSGGELRRAEIARLLFQQAKLSILDEPLNHLDMAQQFALLDLLRKDCVSTRRGLILVLHDVNLARRVATHLLLLYGDGRWRAGPVDPLGGAELLSDLLGYPLQEHSCDGRPWLVPDHPSTDRPQ